MRKYHPFTLLSIWLMTILIAIQITSWVVQAGAEKVDEIIQVEYIVLTETEYEEEYEPVEVVKMQPIGEYNISAYCPCELCCGPYADGYTSSGEKATEGITIAADTDVLPLGTEVYIEGIGTRIVQDVGGVIKGNKIDLFFGGDNAHQRALEFGRQYLEVYLEVKQ